MTMKAAIRWACLASALTFGLSGCRHKPVLPPLPPIINPVDLVEIPPSGPPPMIAPPEIQLPPMPVATGPSPRRERKRRPNAAATSTPSTTQPSTAETPVANTTAEETAIGALSLGGEANPRAQQQASELLASIDRRLSALPSRVAAAEKTQVSQVRNFQRQAQDALNSGDVEGATTLGTKARLLLDDLQK